MALFLQPLHGSLPARGVGEGAVHEDDGQHLSPPISLESAQRLERGTHFLAEYPRLFPGSEVAASVELVVMDEVVGIRALCPAPRCLIQLVGKNADGKRNGDVLGVEEVRLVLPVETSRGNPVLRAGLSGDDVAGFGSGDW